MRRIVTRVLVALPVLVGVLMIVWTGTLFFGEVFGKEFSPDTFERRSYTYFELPVVRIQVTPVRRTVRRPQLEQALVDHQYIASQSPPGRWDLAVSMRLGQIWREGDAHILTRYLDARNMEGELHWLEWTTSNPAQARIFWPEIARLAQQELYLFMPDLFALAAQPATAQTFQGDLNRLLAGKYEELAGVELDLQNWAAAERFYTEALRCEPHRASSVRGRAQARAHSGRES